MKEYTFIVNFGSTYGNFSIDANDIDEAYDNAINEIMKSLISLPVEVDFDVECIEEPDDEE